jgi:hypothetical protein
MPLLGVDHQQIEWDLLSSIAMSVGLQTLSAANAPSNGGYSIE